MVPVLKTMFAQSLKGVNVNNAQALQKHFAGFMAAHAPYVTKPSTHHEKAIAGRENEILRSGIQSGNTNIIQAVQPNAVNMANAAIQQHEAKANTKDMNYRPNNGVFNQQKMTPM